MKSEFPRYKLLFVIILTIRKKISLLWNTLTIILTSNTLLTISISFSHPFEFPKLGFLSLLLSAYYWIFRYLALHDIFKINTNGFFHTDVLFHLSPIYFQTKNFFDWKLFSAEMSIVLKHLRLTPSMLPTLFPLWPWYFNTWIYT